MLRSGGAPRPLVEPGPLLERTAPSVLRALDPAEWVLIGLLAYSAVRMAMIGHVEWTAPPFPRGDVVAAAMVVTTLRMARASRTKPWPPGCPDRVLHRLLLPLIVAVPCVGVFADIWPRVPTEGGRIANLLLWTHKVTEILLLLYLPLLLGWLKLGLHLKKHGGMRAFAFFREAGTGAVRVMRDWLPPVAAIIFYHLFPIITNPLTMDQDDLLHRIDARLFFGRDPLMLLERLIWPPLSEWLTFAYCFYVILFPLVFAVVYLRVDRGPFRETAFAVTLTLVLGFVGYSLVPAQGPIFTQHFGVSLDLYYFGWVKEQLMDRTRVPRDCFPSLHTAVALVFLWSSWRHARRLFWILVPIVLSIPIACVYLRYHYVVDVLAGVALAAFVARVAPRLTWEVG